MARSSQKGRCENSRTQIPSNRCGWSSHLGPRALIVLAREWSNLTRVKMYARLIVFVYKGLGTFHEAQGIGSLIDPHVGPHRGLRCCNGNVGHNVRRNDELAAPTDALA